MMEAQRTQETQKMTVEAASDMVTVSLQTSVGITRVAIGPVHVLITVSAHFSRAKTIALCAAEAMDAILKREWLRTEDSE